jgi:hypothetical protein
VEKSRVLTGVCLLSSLTLGWPCGSEEKKQARVYTNEDLDRVKPYRDETGVASRPAVPMTDESARQELGGDGAAARRKRRSAEGDRSAEGIEERWRSQAERLRARLQPLRDKAADLRLQIEERRRQPGVRPYTDLQVLSAQRRLEVLERRIREAESNFEDRARRSGALPGWIR